ncbi:unnamed protein product [Cyclocybe aegerita]|uniref:MAPEG family protein n=1 Tax=Cyclocybe aegerita TaxID=1973307 RepID=A0A8S0XNZ1_CYCAE|nr:unnamed protein product [Cyclocybe aegerita]
MPSLDSPLSLYSIPVMWLISYYPSFLKNYMLVGQRAFTNLQPRTNIARMQVKNVPADLAARIARMEGAHINGLENLPFFGLAVLAGNYAGVDDKALNIASGLYLVWRIVFNYLYFNQTTPGAAGLRSMTWLTSLAFPFYLFIKSAQLLSQKKDP